MRLGATEGLVCFWRALCELGLRRGDMQKTHKVQHEEVLETRQIGITGMTCDNCVRKVERALRSQPGVKEVRVDRAAATATVSFDTTQTNIPALHDALLQSGYHPKAVAG